MSLRTAGLAARRGFWGRRSLSGMLLPGWVEDPTPVVEGIRRRGRLETIEAVAPSSEDSWEHFLREHRGPVFGPDVWDYGASGGGPSSAPARAQEAWEAARAERESAYRAESERQWAVAERRREDEIARQAERERLAATARLGLTEQGELTPVYWQTEALYGVEGARRALRASRR